MVAVAWAAIGLLAATLGVLSTALLQLRGEMRALGADLGEEIRSQGARIDGLDASLSARIDALAARIDAHIDRHAG